MIQLEKLSPDYLLPEMQRRVEELLVVITEKRKSLAEAPAGRIRVAIHGKQRHCYHVTNSTNSNGVYIPKADLKLIRKLAQKDYDDSVLKILERQLKLIENFMDAFGECDVASIFSKLHVNRRPFITPVTLPDEDYAAHWLAQSYKCKSFREGEPEFLTSRGERVRSKSEMIIADILAKHGVPYKYECPLRLAANDGAGPLMVYPDFTCLNLRTREQFLWEHFGRMDDPEYSHKTVAKLRGYRKNGFILGKNLLITMESDGLPLDRKDVESLVKNFLR